MSRSKRWHGLAALLVDAVEHGSRAIERVQSETARRPFEVLEHIAPIAAPAREIHRLHDAAVSTTYGAIRLVNRGVGVVIGVAIDIVGRRRG